MRELSIDETRFVAGGLIKAPGDDDGGGGGTTLPPIIVTPDPGSGGWFPPLLPPGQGGQDPRPGVPWMGGGGGGGTGSDSHQHTSQLAQTLSDAFGNGSLTEQLTDGKVTGAVYSWANYQSTAGVEASANHLSAFQEVGLFNGTKLNANIGLTGNSLALNTTLSGDYKDFGYGITTTNNNLSSAHLDFKGGSIDLGANWSAPDALGVHFSQQFADAKFSATLSSITPTATQLSLSLTFTNGISTSLSLIRDTASSATSHGGYGIYLGLTVPSH